MGALLGHIARNHDLHSGLRESAAEAKWTAMLSQANVRRDQVEAVNDMGQPIGKASCGRESIVLAVAGVADLGAMH